MDVGFFPILWVAIGLGCLLVEVTLDVIVKWQGKDLSTNNGWFWVDIVILLTTTAFNTLS